MMKVEYRPVVGYENKYEVGNDGSIWNLHFRSRGRRKEMKQGISPTGYCRITLRRDGKSKEYSAHRLVLAAFVGPCPQKMVGCHNNGIRTDNNLDNLRWDTLSNNNLDMVRHGTQPTLKLTEEQVLEIRKSPIGGRLTKRLAEQYGVNVQTIYDIKHKRTWRHV